MIKVKVNMPEASKVNVLNEAAKRISFPETMIIRGNDGHSPYIDKDGFWVYYDETLGEWIHTEIGAQAISKIADKLSEAREIQLTGSAHGSGMFDGSEDIQIYTVIDTIDNMTLEEMLK